MGVAPAGHGPGDERGMSLRGLLIGLATAILLLALTVAIALVNIATRLQENSRKVWQAAESIHAAEQIEIELLNHSLDRWLKGLTHEQRYADAMSEEEHKLHELLGAADQYVGSPTEDSLLRELTQHAEEDLKRGAKQDAPGQERLQD